MNNSTENGRCQQDIARFCVPARAADFQRFAARAIYGEFLRAASVYVLSIILRVDLEIGLRVRTHRADQGASIP